MLSAGSAHGAQWETRAAVSTGLVYTDNVCLTEDEKIDKWILTATPSGTVKRTGGRSALDMRFSIGFNTLAESGVNCPNNRQGQAGVSNVSPAPRLRLFSQNRVAGDWLFFDAQAFAGQNLVNAFAPDSGDELNATGNVNTTYGYSLSPYIRKRFGTRYEGLLRYSFDQRLNTTDAVRDSTGERWLFDVGVPADRNKISYGITGDYYEVEFEEFRNRPEVVTSISSYRLRGGYQLSRKLQFYASAGVDRNDFLSTFEDIDDTAWDAGLVWTPNRRVTVQAGTGERFFGTTPKFSIEYRHRRSRLRFNYERELTYTQNLRANSQLPGVGFPNPPVDDPGLSGTPTTLSAQPILNEGYVLFYRLGGKRNAIAIRAARSEQRRAADGRDATFDNASISWNFRFSARTNFRAAVTYAEQDAEQFFLEDEDLVGPVRSSETLGYTLGFDRSFGSRSELIVLYRYRDRESELEFDNFVENRVTLTWRYRFR